MGPTDPNHGPESCGDPKCWQCHWMQKVAEDAWLARKFLVCVGPGGRGCEWERTHIQQMYPEKFFEFDERSIAKDLEWHEQDGRMAEQAAEERKKPSIMNRIL